MFNKLNKNWIKYIVRITLLRNFSNLKKVALVGSGPTSFYIAQSLLKRNDKIKVDMYEKSIAPFGLVRYGVAPDHEDVKNVINTFKQVTKNPNFSYYGNINIGYDLEIKQLKSAYDAVVLAIGASIDKKLNIPGEDLKNVLGSKDIVGWYNGNPGSSEIIKSLDMDTVSVIGIGNVSLDVARILLSPIERLKNTDVPESVIEVLSKSRIERVKIISRRGPLQVSFTLKEFRELSNLINMPQDQKLPISFLPENIIYDCISSDKESWNSFVHNLPRPKMRIINFMEKVYQDSRQIAQSQRGCEVHFLKSPKAIISSTSNKDSCGGLILINNSLIGEPSLDQKIASENENTEKIDCGMVIKCLGYRVVELPEVPYDYKRGTIACQDDFGRVQGWQTTLERYNCAFYSSGWAQKGAHGVIVNSGIDGKNTAEVILEDFSEYAKTFDNNKQGFPMIKRILEEKNVKFTSFQDWEKINLEETKAGSELGKPREKVTSSKKMMEIIFSEAVNAREK